MVTAATAISTLSLHDALPIFRPRRRRQLLEREHPGELLPEHVQLREGTAEQARLDAQERLDRADLRRVELHGDREDRKSTRLNSSHANISYAVFCLKKKRYWK